MKTKDKDKMAANPAALSSHPRAKFDNSCAINEDGFAGNKGIFRASPRSCLSADRLGVEG